MARLVEHIGRCIEPDKLALRSWIATYELLVERQWQIRRDHGRIQLSTGSLEGKIVEWLAPLRRRGGRWQNARRLNLVLGLITPPANSRSESKSRVAPSPHVSLSA